MRRGKYQARRKRSPLLIPGILLIAVVLVLSLKPLETAMAYMFKQTETVTNKLQAAEAEVEVDETFSNNTKSSVSVQNKGNIPVYIRVTLVSYWKKGNDIVAQPDGGDVTINMKIDGWLKKGDVYYYTTPVDPGKSTSVLVESATAVVPDGYTYHLDIYADAIQAEPTNAVTDAWDVTLTGTTITAVP